VFKTSQEKHFMAAWKHILAASDHENNGFHSRNWNTTKPFPIMTKIDHSVDHIHYWAKERRNSLTTSKIWLQKCITI